MSSVNGLTEKLEQFNEFFSIEHDFSVNINVLPESTTVDFDTFIQGMPLPFKIASDVGGIDKSALRAVQGLGNSAEVLVDFLNHQAKKIDLLIGYILSQQDEEENRYQGIKFGGGGLIFLAAQPFVLNQRLEMKIFLLKENTAVYCYGEIIDVEKTDVKDNNATEQYTHKVVFTFIKEDDREILVRASLHQQSLQLQALARKRNQSISPE